MEERETYRIYSDPVATGNFPAEEGSVMVEFDVAILMVVVARSGTLKLGAPGGFWYRALHPVGVCRRGRRLLEGILVDCDDLSGWVQEAWLHGVDPTSPGGGEKFNGKGSLITTETFSERLAKGFVETPKLSVLRCRQS
ncbi:hypothetical protein FNV43_RR27196 [Rhamnella rubrinervis]|uniref:Uncharacterized protein n=1 Tax=Rhamnella rubrinervis TaxID=2594499 RepID=A0A8K0DL73_9ROSA|nr:hypothetical protein FNV43_RR27196 [Rhamnella rubrinervis]